MHTLIGQADLILNLKFSCKEFEYRQFLSAVSDENESIGIGNPFSFNNQFSILQILYPNLISDFSFNRTKGFCFSSRNFEQQYCSSHIYPPFYGCISMIVLYIATYYGQVYVRKPVCENKIDRKKQKSRDKKSL